MFNNTPYIVDSNLILEALNAVPDFDFRMSLNEPSGLFFYDAWNIKPAFKNSIWDNLLSAIPEPIGEARIIKLDPGTCYRSHADIDDRWHLSIIAEKSYVVNLDTEKMYPQVVDNQWHYFEAGGRHSAVNFGSKPRIQLVVRKLLNRGTGITAPVTVSITLKNIVEDRRFIFDDIVSPWLNVHSKMNLIDNFQYKDLEATFVTDASIVPNLEKVIELYFNLRIVK